MLCYQCRDLLSDYIDGAMELGEQAKIEHHIGECDPCRAVRDDFLQIIHFSRNLPSHTPSSAVWASIKSEIEGSGRAGGPPRLGGWWAKVTGDQSRVHMPLIPLIGVFVLLVALAIAVQLRSLNRTPSAGGAVEAQQGSLAGIPDTSSSGLQDMEREINLLKASVEAHSANWNPEVRTAYNRDILHVDQSLARCRHELVDHPNNDVCREMMMNAYREKVRLLEGFTDF